MNEITVIGIGSPHVGDQVGWQVVDYLKQDHALQTLSEERIKLITCDRPGLSLLDYLQGTRLAILVDAIDGGEAGNIRCLQQEQLLSDDGRFSSHSLGVADALKIGEKMDMLPETVVLYGMEVGDGRDQGDECQEQIEEMAKNIIARIEEDCKL